MQHVDIVCMHLHFLNGGYLMCRKYVYAGQAQTYQGSSKLLHLSTSAVTQLLPSLYPKRHCFIYNITFDIYSYIYAIFQSFCNQGLMYSSYCIFCYLCVYAKYILFKSLVHLIFAILSKTRTSNRIGKRTWQMLKSSKYSIDLHLHVTLLPHA